MTTMGLVPERKEKMRMETENAVRSIVNIDPEITREMIEQAIDVLRGRTEEVAIVQNVRFRDAQEILKVSRRTLRHYLDSGYLDRVFGGGRRNSKGKVEKWKGYKLHLVVGDGDMPLCAFLSSAGMHDSQAMIPMMQRASASFDYFYDLADAAYDAAGARAMSRRLNHEPLIDGNPRRGEKPIDYAGAKFVNIIPAEALRYRIRTGVGRVFGMLKDSRGG